MDLKPRQFSSREQRLLLEYANEIMEEIAWRASVTPPAEVSLPA